MKSLRFLILALALLGISFRAPAGEVRRTWIVDGVERFALIYMPQTTTPAPLVFVFHGHGGTAQGAARSFAIHTLWPEVVVVYPQGLKTPGRLTDPEGKKSGWQSGPGAQDDRDLHFFDAILASLRQDAHVDDRRIYATGHSNGGGFTYLLWATRGEQFAAFAPSAAAVPQIMGMLKPKPVLHLAGSADPLVKFAWQQATMTKLREINGCGEGESWAPLTTRYPSKVGDTPVLTFIHPGGHQFVPEGPALIVRFFKEHTKK